jgi:uncharacterized protein (TIGR02271 family)
MADRTTAIAIFDDRTQAQQAIDQLKRAGFTEKQIGVTARDAADGEAGAGDGRKETHAKEGAIAGVSAGAGVGALWGLGILAGVLPAIGPAIAGGTLAAILSSAAAGAATAGLAGTLIGLGIPEDEANYYDEEFRAGRVLVTVDAGGRLQEAQAILMRSGGYDMRSAPERTAAASARAGMRSGSATRDVGDRTIEVREEELRINKRPVTTGEAEVRKEVHTERRSVEVPVRKEELVIERHAVGRHPASGPVGRDESVRIPLSEEQIEVEKRPVVTEEVKVGKRVTQEEERVEADLAKENVKVQKKRGRDPRPSSR